MARQILWIAAGSAPLMVSRKMVAASQPPTVLTATRTAAATGSLLALPTDTRMLWLRPVLDHLGNVPETGST